MTVSSGHDDIDWAPSVPAIERLVKLAWRGLDGCWVSIVERGGSNPILHIDGERQSEGADAAVLLPIKVEGAEVATLTLGRGTEDPLPLDKPTLATELATAIGRELELSAQNARLEQRLRHDGLRETRVAIAAEPPLRTRSDDDGFRILLADDLDLNRKLIGDMLGLEGHVVEGVSDGASAVRAAATGAYDLILMDLIMPGMGGLTATAEIRRLPEPACSVPIVALTAHSMPEQLDDCMAAGMNATLTKPLSFDSLLSTVRRHARSGPDDARTEAEVA